MVQQSRIKLGTHDYLESERSVITRTTALQITAKYVIKQTPENYREQTHRNWPGGIVTALKRECHLKWIGQNCFSYFLFIQQTNMDQLTVVA